MFQNFLIPMVTDVLYVFEAFILLWIAKAAYTRIYRRVELRSELFERKNVALGISVAGYLFGIVIAVGGVLSGSGKEVAGDAVAWQATVSDVACYGIGAIALMLVSSFLCEKILLPHFNNTKEVVEDHNLGTAFVEAGMHVGNGLIVSSIAQGSGEWWVGPIFWLLAQAVLLITGLLYEWVTPHSIHHELERDNTSVGLAFGGALVGMGNVVGMAVAGDFLGWQASLVGFALYAIFGLVILFVVHKITDVLLAPGVCLAAEQSAEEPNVGAGLLEAFGYVGGSMLIVWGLG